MTVYTFTPNPSNQLVSWDDPTVWLGGVVPDSPDADVVVPLVTTVSTGQPYVSAIEISQGQSFSVNSVSLTANELLIEGSLSVDRDHRQRL